MIGLIFCAFGTREYLDRSLAPWLELRKAGRVKICAVSVKFAGFEGEDDGTREALRGYLNRYQIDGLIEGPDNIPETTARSMALSLLRDMDVSHIWQADSDEFPSVDQINRIIEVIDLNPWVDWFRLSLKNYVFDTKTYLTEPFTPPRIHRVIPNRYPALRANRFTGDNDIGYKDEKDIGSCLWPQETFASQVIPANYVWIPHYSWLNDERSKRKTQYQWGRWGNCSFMWDDAKGLIFNPALPEPRIVRES